LLLGIGFIAVLTATVASVFIKTEASDEHHQLIAALRRIEDDLAEVKTLLAARE
jgi:hypothetical protein